MTANIFTSIPDFNELLALIPDASEFSIDKEKISGELKEIYGSIENEKEFESLESIKLRLRSRGLSNDDLIEFATNQIAWNEANDWHNDELKKLNDGLFKLLGFYSDSYKKSTNAHNYAHQLDEISKQMATTASFLEGQIKGRDTQKTIFSQNGGKAKSAKNDPLRELAIKLVTEKSPPYPSRRNAALSIEDEIILAGKALYPSVILSKMQAETTITGWLKDAGLLPPKPKN